MTTRVLIAFYSRGGVTEALAKAVAEGAKPRALKCGCAARASSSGKR